MTSTAPNKNNANGLEDLIKELEELGKRRPLSQKDLARAEELMKILKENGFINKGISDIMGGLWKEPTIKLRTRGVTVRDPSLRKNVEEVLGQLVDMGLTLEDVKAFILVKEDIDSKGIKLEEVADLLGEANRLEIDSKDILDTYMSQKRSDLSIKELREILSYKTDADKFGITLKIMDEFIQVSKIYGEPSSVFEALRGHKGLNDIKTDLGRMSSEKEKIEDQISRLGSEVIALEKRKDSAEKALKTYEMIKALGFDDSTYNRLKASSEKFGGVDQLLDAVNSYTDLTEIKRKRENLEAELKKVQADHAHLQTVIGMCETLLYKYKFSVAAINDIYETAKNYGEPLEVLKAIGKYGEIKKIEMEIDMLNKRKEELQPTVKELEKQLQELKVTITALRTSVNDALAPIKDEITKNVDYVIKKFIETLADMSVKYEQYAQRLGELKGEAGKLEEDLKLGRIMLLLIKYPSEARQVPLEYDALILGGIVNHIKALGVNPTIKLQDVVGAKHWSIGHNTVELIELLEWALKGLKKSTPHG